MRPPHLATIAATLMTAGGGVWMAAMAARPVDAFGGVICGLHSAAQAGVHCGWCYAALALMAAGAGVLSVAGVGCLRSSIRR